MKLRIAHIAVTLALLYLSGCQTNSNQSAAFSASISSVQQRQLDSRKFNAENETQVLAAIVGLLQDLGFKVNETSLRAGVVSGSKGYKRTHRKYGSDVRLTVTAKSARTGGIVVRATFQDIRTAKAPRFYKAEPSTDPQVYRDFFDKLAQSLFLEAHKI
jgi:hypothetical protein